ncbi:cyclic GMP-AMP synthase DncV-like nucleotidyltransferase [Chloroflexota bacterium]
MEYKLREQFSELLRYLAESLDISESHLERAEGRYKSLCEWLGRRESKIATFNPDIYPQGSFRLGTVTKPLSDKEEYDIDLVCEISVNKQQISQKDLKNLIGNEIKAYVSANNMNYPVEESRRCWTLNYADGAQFHQDILPAVPDGESFRNLLKSKAISSNWSDMAIAITDNTLPNYDRLDTNWPPSNPKGYAEWFKERMKAQYNTQRMLLAKSMRANVEDIPDYKVKTPLQQAVQILKRHRDIMFAANQGNKPVSIIITTLAAHAYNNEPDLLEAIIGIIDDMPHHIQTISGVPWVPNPANPLENFADRWQRHPNREEHFRRWLKQVQVDLHTALQSPSIQTSSESLKKSLGERAINTAMQNIPEAKPGIIASIFAGTSKILSRFTVPHRQVPKWPIVEKGHISITGYASKQGFRPWQIQSDSKALPKHCSLRFEAKTDIQWPYKVYWQVVNTGNEAKAANGLRGEFHEGVVKENGRVRKESTLYTGMHWIECFIIKDDVCVARSGEFVVNIE